MWKIIARKQNFLATIIYRFTQDYIYCPRHEVTMGFSTVCTERVIQLSRPDGRSYWTLRRRDWNFPDSYSVPYTPLQDESLTCNETMKSEPFPHFAAR